MLYNAKSVKQVAFKRCKGIDMLCNNDLVADREVKATLVVYVFADYNI